MQVRIVQTAASTDPEVNRAAILEVSEGADLVVFPEAMSRDFGPSGTSMAAYAEPLDGPFVSALLHSSHRSGAAVAAGMFEVNPDDPQRPFNTLVVAHGGEITTYRKVHLYDSFGFKESEAVTPGPVVPTVLDLGGIRWGLMTCYDLRFPEMSRMLVEAGAEGLLLVAAWVAGPRKVLHWETMLRSRAIENLCWVVASAQCGQKYSGHSQVISPYGDVVARLGDETATLDVQIDPCEVAAARAANPSLDNRRLGRLG